MLARKQQKEKECLEWFSPCLFRRFPAQEGEFEEYLGNSERGMLISGFQRGFQRLNVYAEAKRWRGITIHELWEDSFNHGEWWLGYHELLTEEDMITPIPKHAMEFISREIFCGKSQEIIHGIYKEICTTAKTQ